MGRKTATTSAILQSTMKVPRNDENKQYEIADQRDDAFRQHLVHLVDVVDCPRHQPADRMLVVILQRQMLDMFIDVHPKLQQGLLPDPAFDHYVDPVQQVIQDQQPGNNRAYHNDSS